MIDQRPALTGPRPRQSVVRRHPWLFGLAALVLAAAIAVPVVAYVIVPQLVKSTLVESLPQATAPAAGAPPSASSVVLAEGQLQRINAVDFGTGRVLVVDVNGTRFLRFDNVTIAGAPDVYVYLSDRRDGKPGTFTNLGKLKATNGSFNYEIPPGIDLTTVNSVVAWCRSFNVTITYAVLQKS